jgi:rRNA maturation protein Rpf1
MLHLVKKMYFWYSNVGEVPVRGAFPDKTPMPEVIFNDNVRDLDLTYVNTSQILLVGPVDKDS